MPRPILLGICGDSAAGKTTLTRGLVRILGEAQVTHIDGDHYHRYSRTRRSELQITPLHPEANHLDILEQHLVHLRAGEPILKPVYRHRDGSLAPAEYVAPAQFAIVEGMLGFHTPAMRDTYDVRIFLDPPEDLRRRWKVQRDCSRRGYTTDQVLAELDRREADAETFIRPQRRYADIVVSFMPGDRGDAEHLDVKLAMRPGLAHPDLPALAVGDSGIRLNQRGSETHLWIPGTIEPERSSAFEEAIWDRLHFANHLRTERLGEFTVGTELHRSEPLAVAQLLVLYQLVTARAAVALGASGARADGQATAAVPAP
ncbi:MAG TPA: phosphoribulokinase [Solirubrobacteraceae bacterium]|nr:phosphoribulokinase [Solirubrobacteraceae bacterium]